MSFWTGGNFKFRVRGRMSLSDIQSQFGYVCSWEDRRSVTDDEIDHGFFFLPCGSEGSFDILVRRSSKYMTVFYIYGNLRDVYDTSEIKDWYNRMVAKSKRFGMKFHELKELGFYGEHNHYKVYTISGSARSYVEEAEKFSYKNGNWVFDIIKDVLRNIWYDILEVFYECIA